MIKKIILFCFALLILFSCNDEKSNIDSKEFGKEKLFFVKFFKKMEIE